MTGWPVRLMQNQKGVRAEGIVLATQVSGHISEKEYDCHRYDGVLSALHAFVCTSFYSIISHEPPVFNRFFHIFKIFLEE